MKKYIALSVVLFTSTVFYSQINSQSEIFLKVVDSIVSSEVKFLKQKRSTEELRYLKDSTYVTRWNNFNQPCDNQTIAMYFYYNQQGELVETLSKNIPGEGCELQKTKILLSYLNGNLIERILQYPNNENLWVDSFRWNYQYDENNNKTSEITQDWHSDTNTWVNELKYEISYNESNKVVNYNRFLWNNSINNWLWTEKRIKDYDLNNNLIEDRNYVRDFTSNDWRIFTKSTYSYNLNNDILNRIFYKRFNTETVYEWNQITKNEDIYDENNFLIENYNSRTWNNITKDWDNKTKYINSIDDNGNAIVQNFFNWNEVENDWENSSVKTSTFNLDNNVTESITQNYQGSLLKNSIKVNFEYDIDLHLIDYVYMVWDIDNLEWLNSLAYEYNYNDFDILIDSVVKYWNTNTVSWDIDYERHKTFDVHQNLIYENESGTYFNNDIYHYYSEHNITLSSNEFNDVSVFLYPNPSSKLLYFSNFENIKSVKIYDIKGRRVKEYANVSNINISTLEVGVYIMKVVSDKGLKTLKFIKK